MDLDTKWRIWLTAIILLAAFFVVTLVNWWVGY